MYYIVKTNKQDKIWNMTKTILTCLLDVYMGGWCRSCPSTDYQTPPRWGLVWLCPQESGPHCILFPVKTDIRFCEAIHISAHTLHIDQLCSFSKWTQLYQLIAVKKQLQNCSEYNRHLHTTVVCVAFIYLPDTMATKTNVGKALNFRFYNYTRFKRKRNR